MTDQAGTRTRARFVRESADVRRQAMIDATARCLAERGVGGTSVRAICARAGVSSGLLTHYFAGVDALILATYGDVGAKVSAALDKGWALYGDPTYAFDHANGVMRCGQAVTKEVEGQYSPDMKLGAQ